MGFVHCPRRASGTQCSGLTGGNLSDPFQTAGKGRVGYSLPEQLHFKQLHRPEPLFCQTAAVASVFSYMCTARVLIRVRQIKRSFFLLTLQYFRNVFYCSVFLPLPHSPIINVFRRMKYVWNYR